jgi:hypothetical protein
MMFGRLDTAAAGLLARLPERHFAIGAERQRFADAAAGSP